MSFFGLTDPELENTLPEYTPGSLDAISQAQSLSIVALALGAACGVNWKREVGPVMDLTVNVVISVFQFLLRTSENTGQLRSHTKALSSSTGDLTKRRSSSPVVDTQLSKALVYFRMVLEVFQWDSCHRNVFAWAFHLTRGIIREILLLREAGIVYRVTSCMRVLKLAERVLNLVYSSRNETVPGVASAEQVTQESEQEKKESSQDKQEFGQDKLESELSGQDSEQGQQESGQFKQELGQDKPESPLDKQESKEVKQEPSRQGKEGNSLKEASEDVTLDNSANALNSQSQQHSLAQTHLNGSWLLLYNFTSESCKKMQRRRSSLFSVQEGESRSSGEKKMVELLCEVQEKLQALGVRIPTNGTAAKENVEGEVYVLFTLLIRTPWRPRKVPGLTHSFR